MITDRIAMYKRVVDTDNYSKYTTEELVLMCKKSTEKEWVKVHNNTNLVYKDEEIRKIYDKDGKIKETWVYKASNNYDSNLFGNILLKFEDMIYNIYSHIKNPIDEDEYFDAIEEALLKSIRSFDESTGNKFITLFKLTCQHLVFNETYRKTAILHRAKDENGKITKKVVYIPKSTSLNAIIDNPACSLNYHIPYEEMEYSLLDNLKDKYLKEGNLMGWIITDIYSSESCLMGIPKLMAHFTQNRDFKSKSLKEIYFKIFKYKLYNILGFEKSEDVKKFIEIKSMNTTKEQKLKKFHSFINKNYNLVIENLKVEFTDGGKLCY